MTPFDPDGPFAMHSLSRLEAAGINIVTLLSRNILQLASCVGVTLDQNDESLNCPGIGILVKVWR